MLLMPKSDAGHNTDYWPYYQLEQMIMYKAALAGVAVEKVPAAYTSLACSKANCHAIGERKGRQFVCSRCGMRGHADYNASRNIGQWLGMACPIVLQQGTAVMAAFVQSGGVNDAPLSSVSKASVQALT